MGSIRKIKYLEPKPFEGIFNDIVLDGYIAFRTRCYQASPLDLLDLYLSMGLQYDIPFHTFLFKLVCEKRKDDACPFTLIHDIEPEEFNKVLKEKLKNAKYPFELSLVIASLGHLNNVNP